MGLSSVVRCQKEGFVSNLMHISMKKVYDFFLYGDFSPTRVGWSFYPITRKDHRYVVDLRWQCPVPADNLNAFMDELRIFAQVYDYREQKRVFKGHKGKRLFSCDVTFLDLDEDTSLDLRRASTDDLKIYLPKIMQEIFLAFETDEQEDAERQKKVLEAAEWDGVVH